MLLADSLAELRPCFGQFSRYMREEIDQVFASQGNGTWPKRQDDSQVRFDASKAARITKIRAGQYNSLRGRLRSEKRRAERRLARTPSSSKLSETRRRSVQRYEAQLAELDRLAAGGDKNQRGMKGLYARAGRREQRAAAKIAAVESGALLGQIANSFAIDFDKTQWQMASRIPWAGVQNSGGPVGNGAELPARTFLEWTPARLQKFVEMCNAYTLKRMQRGR